MSVTYLQSFRETARLSPGRYTSVTGYQSSRGSKGNYLLRPGVSKKHRLEESIEWAQRLNVVEVANIMQDKYGTQFSPVDVQAYIKDQIDSWETSKTKPQRANPYRAIASAKNGQPILNVQKEGPIECFYIVGQKEAYKHIQDGEPKAPPKSDSARVKKWVRDNSESGKYITLKLQTGEDQNFESVCINGQVYNPEQLRAMVIEAREAL